MNQEKTDLPDNELDPAVAEAPETAETTADVFAAESAQGVEEDTAAATDDMPELQANDDDESAESAADELAALREALVRKTADAERYHDQALRAVAEADNVRKRAQRDAEAARKFALEKFAAELLGVRDSLDMGLKASDDENAELAHVVEGMELTRRMLASAMEKFGVEVVNPEGEVFDPELHEAVSMQPTDAQAPNTVVAVVQKGYTLNGRVLRAAMVVVAQATGGA